MHRPAQIVEMKPEPLKRHSSSAYTDTDILHIFDKRKAMERAKSNDKLSIEEPFESELNVPDINNAKNLDTYAIKSSNDNKDLWSEAHLIKQKQEFKDKLQCLVQQLSCPETTKSYKCLILSKIEELMSHIDNEQYTTLDSKITKYYENILDIGMELNLQSIVFKILKEEGDIDISQESNRNILGEGDESSEIIYLCTSVLAAMASGSVESSECVDALGLRDFSENLCLQRENDEMSVLAFKLLSCIISGDESYAGNICGQIGFHTRAKELLQNDHLCDCAKVWIIFFWNWAMHSYDETSELPLWVLHTVLSSAFAFLEKGDIIFKDRAVGLMRTLFEEEYIGTFDDSVKTDGFVEMFTDVVKQGIPTLISCLTKPFPNFVRNTISLLSLIFRADRLYDCENKFKRKLMYIGISNGLLINLIELLQQNNEDFIFDSLFLVTVLSQYDQQYFFKFERLYGIMDYIGVYLRSCNLRVAAQLLVVLHNFLNVYSRSTSSLLRDYVIYRHDLVEAIFALMKRVTYYKGKVFPWESDICDDDENNNLAVVTDFGLRCMTSLLDYGLCKEEQDLNSDRFVAIFKSDDVIKLMTDLKEMDLNSCFSSCARDFEDDLWELLRRLIDLFHSRDISMYDHYAIFEDFQDDE